jgi:D-tyrosyl-tRNA(Tyr) deacylase
VTRASVTVDGEVFGSIGPGMVILLGVTHHDSPEIAGKLAAKAANLRIFDDAAGIMNRSALDLLSDPAGSAAVLLVSQFTLYADTRKGRRPSYVAAAQPALAEPLVNHFGAALRSLGLTVETGVFGAEMAVELVNDGPVTILLDSDDR